LALALCLYTLQRGSDVVRLGLKDIRNDAFQVKQKKTGTQLSVPIHPELKRILEAASTDRLTFLATRYGTPFKAKSFSTWFVEVCEQAGLPEGASAHGLRKAGCRRLAEAGCSAPEIAALSGHLTLAEVQRYIDKADKARMAKNAMVRMAQAFPNRASSGKPY
jgi:integrase